MLLWESRLTLQLPDALSSNSLDGARQQGNCQWELKAIFVVIWAAWLDPFRLVLQLFSINHFLRPLCFAVAHIGLRNFKELASETSFCPGLPFCLHLLMVRENIFLWFFGLKKWSEILCKKGGILSFDRNKRGNFLWLGWNNYVYLAPNLNSRFSLNR